MKRSAQANRKERTVSSALWAAYGDAIGFVTELADPSMVKRRTGTSGPVVTTVPWERLVGGRFGALVEMPAGTYSDDTQLRLAASRSIRHDGFFDVESLAKIELPVWLGYSLGSGLGSKAAATSLTASSTTWYSNFFRTDKASYVGGGGNGAAMRVQPHVWAATDLWAPKTYLADVVRNAITTHGHVRGIAGAMIHAETLAFVFREDRLPSPEQWTHFESVAQLLPEIVESDSDLKTFWLPTWERESGQTIAAASASVSEEWRKACEVASAGRLENKTDYALVVEQLGGLRPEERGSGLKAALFAMCAAWALRESEPNDALGVIANLLHSDTDTIATMAGALLGALPNQHEPSEQIQDRAYICFEAMRLHDISQRKLAGSFSYPDLLYWQSPKTSLDVLGMTGEQTALYGLGEAEPIGSIFKTRQSDTCFQWFKLGFGQTVLCKRRVEPRAIPAAALPSVATTAGEVTHLKRQAPMHEPDLFGSAPIGDGKGESQVSQPEYSLDAATDEAIRSDFNPTVVGRHLLQFSEAEGGLELAVAYAAIVVKARRARIKRGRRPR